MNNNKSKKDKGSSTKSGLPNLKIINFDDSKEQIHIEKWDSTYFSFEFKPEYKVEQIKQKIFEEADIPTQNQILMFSGQVLQNSKRLDFYKISKNDFLQLIVNDLQNLGVIVLGKASKYFRIFVFKNDNLDILLKRIAKSAGINDIKKRELLYNGDLIQEKGELQSFIKNFDNAFVTLKESGIKIPEISITITILNASKTKKLIEQANVLISTLKKKIEFEEGIRSEEQIMIFSGVILEDKPICLYTSENNINIYMFCTGNINELIEKYSKPHDFEKKFLIEDEISSGSFGKVFKIKELSSGNYLGLKKLELKNNLYRISMLYSVAQLKAIEHQNLMRMHEIYFHKNKILIISEYLEETLGHLLKRTKKNKEFLEINNIIHIFREICQGLSFLFSNQMVHGDLKLSNIMCSSKNTWKLIDYDAPVSSVIDGIFGTKNYMSPEYAEIMSNKYSNNNSEYSFDFKKLNDVWCLGIILYYMIYLQFPYFAREESFNYPVKPELLFLVGYNISEAGKELLLKIFSKPSERISLKDILKHKFLDQISLGQSKLFPEFIKLKSNDKMEFFLSKVEKHYNYFKPLSNPFQNPKIIWHDANIGNTFNTRIYEKYSQKIPIIPFADYVSAYMFLQDNEERWLVITSGTNGETLTKLIHDNPSVIAIVVFCGNPSLQGWAANYKKIIKIINRSFIDVIRDLQSYFINYLSSYVFATIDSKEIGTIAKILPRLSPVQNQYQNLMEDPSVSYDISLQFALVVKQVLERGKKSIFPKKELILEEIVSLANSEEEKNIIKKLLSNVKPKEFFRIVVCTLTNQIVYRNFNNCFTTNNYSKILETLIYSFGVILSHQIEINKKIQPGQIIYRGIKNNIINEYIYKHTMFWKAFKSTSESLETAEKFTNFEQSEGTIFEIRLSKKNPHPHLKLEKFWSMFPIEKEVLLWPNFAFRVITFRKEKWYNYVVLEQDESYEMMFHMNGEVMKIWWRKFISERIETPFCDFFKNFKCRIKDATDFLNFFEEMKGKIFGNLQKLTPETKVKERIFLEVQVAFSKYIRNKLMFGDDQQQNQVILYHILIRDMDLFNDLKTIWIPYVEKISDIFLKVNSALMVKEIFDLNKEFFFEMKKDVMERVNKIADEYEIACSEICLGLFS